MKNSNAVTAGERHANNVPATGKHTPGPWEVHKSRTGKEMWINGGGATVCDTGDLAAYPLSDADVRLIAAAPELLDALKAAVMGDPAWVSEAKIAIAKAEGRQS